MTEPRTESKFRQKRSIDTKQKMLEAAEECFCRNGYNGSSIQKMAEAAEVSVGSYYFYFKNKEEILMEVYEIQNERFLETIVTALHETAVYQEDRRKWLRNFMGQLFETYCVSGTLRAELRILSYEKKQVAQKRALIRTKILYQISEAVSHSAMFQDMKVKSPETALMLTADLMDAVYDRIVEEEDPEQKIRLETECVDLLYKYLLQ